MHTSLWACIHCAGTGLPDYPTSDSEIDYRLCATCRRDLMAALSELPAQYAECENALLSRGRPIQQRVSGGGGNRGMRLNDEVVHARDSIRTVLRSWVRLVMDEKGLAAPKDTPLESCRLLIKQIGWLADHPAAADFAAEILRLGRTAEHAVQVATGTSVSLGSCARPGCESPLSFASRSGRSASIRCLSGHTWFPHEWLALSRRGAGR